MPKSGNQTCIGNKVTDVIPPNSEEFHCNISSTHSWQEEQIAVQ